MPPGGRPLLEVSSAVKKVFEKVSEPLGTCGQTSLVGEAYL